MQHCTFKVQSHCKTFVTQVTVFLCKKETKPGTLVHSALVRLQQDYLKLGQPSYRVRSTPAQARVRTYLERREGEARGGEGSGGNSACAI